MAVKSQDVADSAERIVAMQAELQQAWDNFEDAESAFLQVKQQYQNEAMYFNDLVMAFNRENLQPDDPVN